MNINVRLICPVLNEPIFKFCYIIFHTYFKWPSFEFALRSEGEMKENGRNFPCVQYNIGDDGVDDDEDDCNNFLFVFLAVEKRN